MSGSSNHGGPAPTEMSIFDEKPGHPDDEGPQDPDAIAPEVIAPDLGDPKPFHDGPF